MTTNSIISTLFNSDQPAGPCNTHTQQCCGSIGLYLRVKECSLLLLNVNNDERSNKTRGTFIAAPYLDEYGETDQNLRYVQTFPSVDSHTLLAVSRRGNPLHFCEERYRTLHRRWLSHSIPELISHETWNWITHRFTHITGVIFKQQQHYLRHGLYAFRFPSFSLHAEWTSIFFVNKLTSFFLFIKSIIKCDKSSLQWKVLFDPLKKIQNNSAQPAIREAVIQHEATSSVRWRRTGDIFLFQLNRMANARTQVTAEQIIHSRKSDLDFSQASTGAMCNARASTWGIHVPDRDCIPWQVSMLMFSSSHWQHYIAFICCNTYGIVGQRTTNGKKSENDSSESYVFFFNVLSPVRSKLHNAMKTDKGKCL